MKNVVIIGGGTAGWLTALVVNKFWINTKVTLIESSKIGILGAGEGGTPNFGRILELLKINQKDFFEETGASVKHGLILLDWTHKGSKSHHFFAGDKPNNVSPSYAYHFDAKKVSKYFKNIAIERGVNWIDDEVENISKTKEFIQNVTLKETKEKIDVDFVFDCSGFSRIVTGKLHNEEWIDYSDYLILNKALGFFLPQNKKITTKTPTNTNMIAMSCGWMWQIELQHRWGCGYAFNENYITIEDAKKEVETYLGSEIKIEKVFDFKPGRYKRSWIGNSISIGLSYGFLEPLEATSLMSTIMQLKRLIDKNFDESYRDGFNKWCEEINEQNMMFVRYHYLNEKLDTPFWIDSYNKTIPEKLKNILDNKNNLKVKTNKELIDAFNLKETSENELTFFIYNYQMIFQKNRKIKQKDLI